MTEQDCIVNSGKSKTSFLGLIQLMRPKQWVKNVFVLGPLIFSGLFLDVDAVLRVCVAFILFCVAASATYIINDYRDIEKDRKHPTKSKKRPLASGAVIKRDALILLGVLYAALVASFFWFPALLLPIGGYLLLNVTYTLYLKHQPVLDIFTIAIGFVLRVYAGAVVLEVPVSSWMFVTTLCLALFLAAVKRRQEMIQVGDEGRSVLEKYSVSLVDRYAEMSATGALLFYSLFVMTERPEMIVSIPFVLFGLFRYWYVVETLDGGESPTDVLYSDGQLILCIAGWVGVCLYSLLGGVV